MRHLEVKDLWLQASVKDGRVTLRKIPSSPNVSDVLTKYSDKVCCTKLLGLSGIRVVAVESPNWAEGAVGPSRVSCLCRALCGRCFIPSGSDAQAALDLTWAARKESRQR